MQKILKLVPVSERSYGRHACSAASTYLAEHRLSHLVIALTCDTLVLYSWWLKAIPQYVVVYSDEGLVRYTPLRYCRLDSHPTSLGRICEQDKLTRPNLNPIWTAVNVFASIIAIFLFVWSRSNRGKETPDARAVVYVCVVVTISSVVALGLQQMYFDRKQRLADSLATLRWAFLDLQELAATSQPTAEHIKDTCTTAANKLATTLTQIARKSCTVCIKLVENDPNSPEGARIDPLVTTLCRDDGSRDRELKTFSVKHWIKDNTDFQALFDQLGTALPDHFFCNNLLRLQGYKNASIPANSTPPKSRVPGLSWYYSRKHWPLPYRSTVVFRIARLRESSESKQLSIVGFLCVASNHINVFSKNDLNVIAIMADCLYHPVTRYSQLKTANRTRKRKQPAGGNT